MKNFNNHIKSIPKYKLATNESTTYLDGRCGRKCDRTSTTTMVGSHKDHSDKKCKKDTLNDKLPQLTNKNTLSPQDHSGQ